MLGAGDNSGENTGKILVSWSLHPSKQKQGNRMNNFKETNKVIVDSYGCFGRSDPIGHSWDGTRQCCFRQGDREEPSELSSTGGSRHGTESEKSILGKQQQRS